MLGQIFGLLSLGLLVYWVFSTSKKRGYTSTQSILWISLFVLLALARNPLLMMGGFLVFTVMSIKHQLSGGSKLKLKTLLLCSKCGYESKESIEYCPKCNNHLSKI